MIKITKETATAVTAIIKSNDGRDNLKLVRTIADRAYVTNGQILFSFPVPADSPESAYQIAKIDNSFYLTPDPERSALPVIPYEKVIPAENFLLTYAHSTDKKPSEIIAPAKDPTIFGAILYGLSQFIGAPFNVDYIKLPYNAFKSFTVTKEHADLTNKPIKIKDTNSKSFFVIMPIMNPTIKTKEL